MAGTNPTSKRARACKRERLSKRPDIQHRQGQSARRSKGQRQVAAPPAPSDDQVFDQMSQHIRGLNLVMSALVVSVAALRHQNCEADEDIARVLERAAIDRLDIEIENVADFSRISRDTLERVRPGALEGTDEHLHGGGRT